jgi:ribonucleoside-diphosphate reductase alpha chain
MEELTTNALKVLEKRYLLKDGNGTVTETPDEMFRRVARNIAQADGNYGGDVKKTENEFFTLLSNLYFLPNSPTLMNAGTGIQQLSACFVLPVEDSMDHIFETLKNTALIHQSGGGTGFSFSRIRPAGDIVRSTGGIASGPVSFMKVFNSATDVIKQGGRRRGANMGILRVDHPDIMEFVTCKDDVTEITNFNISVAVTDEFMEQVNRNEDYDLVNPRTGKREGDLNAGTVFNTIVEGAWKSGEPGIIFIDEINRHNPTLHVGEIEATNPCGEQPLLPYESCNLGSINLARMTKDGDMDWELLKSVTWGAVHFLDNVIDMNRYPIPQIEEMTLANRKIGLGVMGFADLLLQASVPYGSDESLQLAGSIMAFIQKEAKKASAELGRQRGSFPNFPGSAYEGEFEAMRNATVTTIAPTGSISIIAGCSSGIEPLFAIAFTRNVLDKDDRLYEINPYFECVAREMGFFGDDLLSAIAENSGSVQGIPEVPDAVQQVFLTSLDISPERHVRMQAAFQKFVDNATSKTINLREEATWEDVRQAYLLAYELKCRGITVYRYGSRPEQVLTTRAEKRTDEYEPRARPQTIHGVTRKITTGCGNLYVTMNTDDRGLFEVFARLGKAGGCADAQLEAVGRLISLSLRSGIKPPQVVKQLKAIRCPNPRFARGGPLLSCPDAIAKAIEEHLQGKDAVEPQRLDFFGESREEGTTPAGEKAPVGVCPDCGSPLVYEEGCRICKQCGFSTCG